VANVIAATERDQSLGHEGAIETGQNCNIRNRAKRNMMKRIE
jgi:hypothetical protein